MTDIDCPGCDNEGTLWQTEWEHVTTACALCGFADVECTDCGSDFTVTI